MAPGPTPVYPSIQSFYKREEVVVPPKPAAELSKQKQKQKQGDGFTEEEMDPLNRTPELEWESEGGYRKEEEVVRGIQELVPGPGAVRFAGRVVGFRTYFSGDGGSGGGGGVGAGEKKGRAAGWHSLLVRDEGGVVSVKLYFSRDPYALKLGMLVTVWTGFVSDFSKAGGGIKSGGGVAGVIFTVATNHVSLFPGRVTSDHIKIHDPSEEEEAAATDGGNRCRLPLNYREGEPLPGLMTLGSYMASGHDGVEGGVRLLVCVKSIGARKRIRTTTAAGGEAREVDLSEVWLFDHTGEIKMTVWNEVIDSVKGWTPGRTVLLITDPGYRVESHPGKGSVGLQRSTMVDVDPGFADAEWLRRYAARLTRRESVAVPFPEGVWDVEGAEYGVNVILYTLADIDEMVRSNPRQVFTGHINVTIMDLALVRIKHQKMLMCAECCGIPVYANTPKTPCPNCSRPVSLLLNPKIIGTLLDETGCISAGKLVWSDRAWEQLLGRPVEHFLDMDTQEVRLLEQRMAFLRMHLVFGWDERVGRLAVLGMRS